MAVCACATFAAARRAIADESVRMVPASGKGPLFACRLELLQREDVAHVVERLVAGEALGLVDARAVLLLQGEDRVVPVAVPQHVRDVVAPARPALHRGEEQQLLRLEEAVDRKSTRLNSSHVEISYAVFCLKKKTNDNKT